jgi:Arc/MetJ-type ribon-helix-helix transcriptional regulator
VAKKLKQLHVPIPEDDIKQVYELAKEAKFKSVSAYIRSLIEADAEQRDVELKFGVRDMGYRERPEPKPAA